MWKGETKAGAAGRSARAPNQRLTPAAGEQWRATLSFRGLFDNAHQDMTAPDASARDIGSLVADSWSAGRGRAVAETVDPFLIARGVRPKSGTTPGEQDQMRMWLESLDPPTPSVFMDTTTLVGAMVVLSPYDPPLGPLLLWDLAALATNVVCYERVAFFQAAPGSLHGVGPTFARGVDDDYLNRAFRDRVFLPLVVPSAEDEPGGAVHAIMRSWWDSARQALAALAHEAGTSSIGGKELEAMRLSWSSALGRDIPVSSLTDPFDPEDQPENWDWNPPSLSGDDFEDFYRADLRDNPLVVDDPNVVPSLLLAGTRISEAAVDRAHVRRGPASLRQLGPTDRLDRFVISELNHRAHFNLRAAQALGLTYGSGLARMPYRRLHIARATSVQQHLHSVLAADRAYGELAQRMRPMSGTRITLPVFLAVALSRAHRPEDVWAELAELREQGTRFRERRSELDHALEEGDADAYGRLQAAVASEAKRLVEQFSPEQIGAGVEQAIPHIAGAAIGNIGDQISLAHSLLRTVLPIGLLKDLHRRLFHPEYAFLTDVRRASASMTNAMPKIAKLWGLDSDLARDELAGRFDAFGALNEN
jgi:hypothetical protein